MNGCRTIVVVLLVSLIGVPGAGTARLPAPDVFEGAGVHPMCGPPPVLVAWSAAPAPAEAVSPTLEAGVSPVAGQRAAQALLDLPLRFVPQTGTDAASSFTVHGANHAIVLTEREVVFRAVDLPTTDHRPPTRHEAKYPIPNIQSPMTNATVRLHFPGANPHPTLEGLSPLGGVVNYFLGNDPARWQANVPTYGAVAYRGLYPGVDLVYRGTAGHLKSEFRVAPGADPGAIQMAYAGAEGLCLRDGALVLETTLGELVEEPPLVYQEVDGVRRAVPGGYVLLGEDRVGFQVGAYDPALPLVIDPELTYSSYLGGSGSDSGNDIAVDKAGNIYVTGYTFLFPGSTNDFPTHNAMQPTTGGTEDAFVTQIVNAEGVYTYGHSTYLGGTGPEYGWGIAVDNAGNVYVAGQTRALDFPTYNAIQSTRGGPSEDAFVTQIVCVNGVYTLGYSTYLGGNDQDVACGIAVSRERVGHATVTGLTYSSDFPTANAIQETLRGSVDVFVTQIVSANGVYTYSYSTYLGAENGAEGWGIAMDDDGNAYITGYTAPGFPITNNAIQSTGDIDAFVTQIVSTGQVYTYGYSSYLGGTDGWDWGYGIAVDGIGNIYVTGETASSDFPTHNAMQATYGGGSSDAFVTQIVNAAGVYTYGYSTYLGGNASDSGQSITAQTDGSNSACVTGYTGSSNFPTHHAIQTNKGDTDIFVTQIVSAFGIYTYGYSTYLGGNGPDYGWGIAVDDTNNVYVTGETRSGDLPITTNAIQSSGGGGPDAFVTRISPANLALAKRVEPAVVGPGQTVTYTLTYDNSSPVTATQVLITDVVPITLTQVQVISSVPLTPTGGVSYTWQVPPLAPGASQSITITGVVSPTVSGVFTLTNRARIASTSPYFADENPTDDEAVARCIVDADPPAVVAVLPEDAATEVPVTAPLVITFSEPIAAGALAYAVAPDPGGWSVAWGAGATAVTLTHAALAYWTTHTVTVAAAADRAGNPLVDAPYTWHWTTVPYCLYLPLALK